LSYEPKKRRQTQLRLEVIHKGKEDCDCQTKIKESSTKGREEKETSCDDWFVLAVFVVLVVVLLLLGILS
jgi:hypothetical protein